MSGTVNDALMMLGDQGTLNDRLHRLPTWLSGAFVSHVVYAGDVGVARPTADVVLWLNFPSEPTNIAAGDLWLDLTATGALELPSSPPVVAGTYLTVPDGAAAGFAAGAADRLFITRCYLPSGSIDRLGCEVTTAAAAGGVVRIGIWEMDPATGLPADLVVDSGTISSETTGIKEATVAATIVGGWHWLGVAAQTQTCSLRGTSNVSLGAVAKTALSTAATAGRLITGASGAFGNAPVPGANATNAPLVHLRWA